MSYLNSLVVTFFWSVLDTEVFFSRRLVESSGSPAKTFSPCPWVNSRGFSSTHTREKLAAFQFCILDEVFQAFFCFRSHSWSRVLTDSGQFMDLACGGTLCVVDPTPNHFFASNIQQIALWFTLLSTVVVAHSFLAFQRFGPHLNLWPSWLLTLMLSKIVICVLRSRPWFYQMPWTSALSQPRLWPPLLAPS